jgi:hypothetical protein
LTGQGSPTASSFRSLSENRIASEPESEVDGSAAEAGDEEGFGDDFDDFEEGQEGGGDFGDFDDGFQQQSGPEGSIPDVDSQPLVSTIDFLSISKCYYCD